MSDRSPAGATRAVRENPDSSVPTRRRHLTNTGEDSQPKPVPHTVKRRTAKASKPPRTPLADQLPVGAYDNRPRYKRYPFHWLYFWMWARLGLHKTKLPAPRPAVRESIDRNFAELYQLAKQKQPIVASVNSKGGAGKTALSTWMAVLIKLATMRTVYAVDANENKGGTASRLGINRNDTVQLRSFLKFEKELSDSNSINQALASHDGSGVLVVASEAADATFFSQGLFERRMRTLHRAGHTLVLDAGNGIPHAANRGSVAIADVLLFPATVRQPDSFGDLEDTRDRYAITNRHYGFGDKVEAGIIVLMGVSKKERLKCIDEYGWNPDNVFRVQKDGFMMGKHVVDWNRIKPKTQLDLSNVAVAIFRTASDVRAWSEQLDENQHQDELGLTEVQYVHSGETYLTGTFPAGS